MTQVIESVDEAQRIGELLGPDTDFDNYTFSIRRSTLRALVAEITSARAAIASLTRKDGSEGVERVLELDGGSIFRAAKRKQGTRLGADTVAALADLLAALKEGASREG